MNSFLIKHLVQKKNSFFLIIIFVFFACSKNGEVVIKIGKKNITDKELAFMYGQYKDSVDLKSISKASFISQVVEKMILEEEAKKLNVNISEEEINSFMKENSINEKKKEAIKLFLLRKHISEKLLENVPIDETIIADVEKNISDVRREKYVFYQIMVNNKEEALQALGEIKKGLDFEKAVEKYSKSPEKSRKGLVDYLNADELPHELLSELRKMKPGDISNVISSTFGFHIIKLKEHIPKGVIDRDTKKKMAIEEAKKILQGNIYADWLAKKKKEYGVSVKWELVEKLN